MTTPSTTLWQSDEELFALARRELFSYFVSPIAYIVIGVFLFRIRERFDTVDIEALDQFRGEPR